MHFKVNLCRNRKENISASKVQILEILSGNLVIHEYREEGRTNQGSFGRCRHFNGKLHAKVWPLMKYIPPPASEWADHATNTFPGGRIENLRKHKDDFFEKNWDWCCNVLLRILLVHSICQRTWVPQYQGRRFLSHPRLRSGNGMTKLPSRHEHIHDPPRCKPS